MISCFSVHLRIMMNVGSLESYQEAFNVVHGCALIDQLFRFSIPFLLRASRLRALQTSHVHYNTMTYIKV